MGRTKTKNNGQIVKIIVDSREQKPLPIAESSFDEVYTAALPYGDYTVTINDAHTNVCWERKSLGDLFGTMTKGYERFKREMERAKKDKAYMELLVEASMTEVGAGYKYSRFPGSAMLKKLATLKMRYGLNTFFFNNRREMAKYIELNSIALAENYVPVTETLTKGDGDASLDSKVNRETKEETGGN